MIFEHGKVKYGYHLTQLYKMQIRGNESTGFNNIKLNVSNTSVSYLTPVGSNFKYTELTYNSKFFFKVIYKSD